jgi:iron complex transport system substrate-binding protein
MNKLLRNGAISLILGLLLASSVALAASDGNSTGYPRTITDGANRTITLTQPIERIIVLNGDLAESLRILGVEDKIIAITDSVKNRATYFPELKNKQLVGTWTNPDYEMIGEIAKGGNDEIEPNIIVLGYALIDKAYGAPAVEKGLAPFKNILSAGYDIHKPDEFAKDLMAMGKIFGKEAEAQEYIDWYNEKTGDVNTAVNGLNMPKVYLESSSTSPKIGELGTYSSMSSTGQVIRITNGYNVAKDLKLEFPKVDWEWVVKQNPDVIILTKYCPASKLGWDGAPSSDSVSLETIRNELISRPGASSVSAVKNNRIYIVDAYKLNGPDGVIGLTYVAKALHPEIDLDPAKVEKEYFEKIGLKFPDTSISIYPEIKAD